MLLRLLLRLRLLRLPPPPPPPLCGHSVSATHSTSQPPPPLLPQDRLLRSADCVLRCVGIYILSDPFVWIGRGGVYHALFHSQIENDDERLCGGHVRSSY